ncbi:MAG: MotA/TolQ/ExbB proton channel family protein [Deltaproteobacteria bacterium]|jgi:biopolymer transport protein ExbB/TolQ|nr:MotA/TolQ/ExbB proton channel family protein [Deltaproteobacteria bacterium]
MEQFSVSNMFLNADSVVKGVMILLALASLASWVVILEKTIVLNRVSRKIWLFKKIAKDLTNEVNPEIFPGFTALIAQSGLKESRDYAGGETRADYRERVERSMRGVLSGRIDRLESHVTVLATVGSTSPFIGLFGTVWGIMNSFVGIASSGETTLAVVAPGIAEALAATAMGLVAAIPAVVAFNKINSTTRKVTKEALSGIGLIGNALSRLRFESKEKSISQINKSAPPSGLVA